MILKAAPVGIFSFRNFSFRIFLATSHGPFLFSISIEMTTLRIRRSRAKQRERAYDSDTYYNHGLAKQHFWNVLRRERKVFVYRVAIDNEIREGVFRVEHVGTQMDRGQPRLYLRLRGVSPNVNGIAAIEDPDYLWDDFTENYRQILIHSFEKYRDTRNRRRSRSRSRSRSRQSRRKHGQSCRRSKCKKRR